MAEPGQVAVATSPIGVAHVHRRVFSKPGLGAGDTVRSDQPRPLLGTEVDRRAHRRSRLAVLGAAIVLLLIVGFALATRDADPLDGDRLLAHGYELQQRGEAGAAAKIYRFLLATEPSATAQFNLGVIEHETGALTMAAARYEAAIALAPDFVPALFNLAMLRGSEGRDDDAIVLYQRVLARDPDNAAANLNLGVLLLERGDEAAASEHIRRAVQRDPSLQRLG